MPPADASCEASEAAKIIFDTNFMRLRRRAAETSPLGNIYDGQSLLI